MPTISNVTLDITDIDKKDIRLATIDYRLSFLSHEITAGSVFLEGVDLLGYDEEGDDKLVNVWGGNVKAQETPIDRRQKVTVKRSILDEDPDPSTQVGYVDEVYARVTLTPFQAQGAEGRSEIVEGQWGIGGRP